MIRAAALAVAGAHAVPAALFVPPVRRLVTPALTGLGDPGHVALTFDDGPHPRSTPHFLSLLDRSGTRATFFVLGRELARAPELGREIVAAGHELAVHGWDHRCFLRRSPAALHADLARTVDLITSVTGARPTWLRAPYGVFSTGSLLSAQRLGLRPVLWTAWGFDWTHRATAESVAATVHKGLRPGGTILLHDSDVAGALGAWRSTLGALPEILARCRQHGLTVGPLRDHGVARARRRPGGFEAGVPEPHRLRLVHGAVEGGTRSEVAKKSRWSAVR